MQRITIDPITRLEGHGKIEIFLNEAGDVANTYFQIPELRGFERFCVGRPADAEAFEAPQFGNLQVRVGHFTGIVEEDLDLAVAFEAGNGVDRDALAHTVAPVCRRCNSDFGSENR